MKIHVMLEADDETEETYELEGPSEVIVQVTDKLLDLIKYSILRGHEKGTFNPDETK